MRFRPWRRKSRRKAEQEAGPLREFVYLDEVSVYSLLASQNNGIATGFTDSQTASLNSEIAGSMGGGFGVAKAELRSRVEAGQSQTSQVLRKATIQGSFKDLRDDEQSRLVLNSENADADPPTIKGTDQMLREVNALATGGWVVKQMDLRRGGLAEVEVTLEADPIFRVSAIITTIREIMQENIQLFGAENVAQLADMRSVGRVLESLLAGLVPLRGRLSNFRSVELDGEGYLVHTALLDQLPVGTREASREVMVVGVAERDLFWKDIRRVLFSGGRFSVFCRLTGDGLQEQWRPIKLMDVLSEVHPVFGEQMRELGETALFAMESAVSSSQQASPSVADDGQALVARYCALLAESHSLQLDPRDAASIAASVVQPQGWIESVDGRRPVLAEATERVDAELGVQTSREMACHLRMAAMLDSGMGPAAAVTGSERSQATPSPCPSSQVKYLGCEIVAVYW